MSKGYRAEWANEGMTFILLIDPKGARTVVTPTDERLRDMVVDPFPTPAAKAVPASITRLQAFSVMRETIRENGKSLYTEALEKLQEAVAATASLPESDERRRKADLAMLAFTSAGTFERNNTLIEQIGSLLDLDADQLDQLFILAIQAEPQGSAS